MAVTITKAKRIFSTATAGATAEAEYHLIPHAMTAHLILQIALHAFCIRNTKAESMPLITCDINATHYKLLSKSPRSFHKLQHAASFMPPPPLAPPLILRLWSKLGAHGLLGNSCGVVCVLVRVMEWRDSKATATYPHVKRSLYVPARKEVSVASEHATGA